MIRGLRICSGVWREDELRITSLSIVFVLLVASLSAWLQPITQTKKTIIRRLTLVTEPAAIAFNIKGQPVKARESVQLRLQVLIEPGDDASLDVELMCIFL